MKTDKRLLASLLIIGLLAVVASAGTWAYFQDTITSTDNGIATQKVSMLFDGVQVGPSGVATVPGVTFPNPIIPGSGGLIQSHSIKNTGTNTASVYVAITGNDISPFNTNRFVFNVAGGSAVWLNKPPKLVATALLPGQTMDASISYTYQDYQNQNPDEGKTLTFDVKYIMVPYLKPAH